VGKICLEVEERRGTARKGSAQRCVGLQISVCILLFAKNGYPTTDRAGGC